MALRLASTSDRSVSPGSKAVGERTIEVANVTIAFDTPGGQLIAVDRVSFDVRRGEFVCLLGPSGCGKSTLLNAIAGFEQPFEGEVTANGQSVEGPGPDRGMVFQQPNLFPWKSVRGNIAHGPLATGRSRKDARTIADELIGIIGLARFADAYPHTLSGGMQQRVAIARALANRPEILLMDEPFGALDAQTRAVMQENLISVWQKVRCTVVFVTHDIEEAILLADRVLIMSAGPGGRLVRDLAVPIGRPRAADTVLEPGFSLLKKQCLDLIRWESARAFTSE